MTPHLSTATGTVLGPSYCKRRLLTSKSLPGRSGFRCEDSGSRAAPFPPTPRTTSPRPGRGRKRTRSRQEARSRRPARGRPQGSQGGSWQLGPCSLLARGSPSSSRTRLAPAPARSPAPQRPRRACPFRALEPQTPRVGQGRAGGGARGMGWTAVPREGRRVTQRPTCYALKYTRVFLNFPSTPEVGLSLHK